MRSKLHDVGSESCEWNTRKPRREFPFFKIIIPYLNEFSLLVKLQVRNEIQAVVLEHYYRNKPSSYPQNFHDQQVLPTQQALSHHTLNPQQDSPTMSEWLSGEFQNHRSTLGDNAAIRSLSGNCNTSTVFNHPNPLYLQRMGEGAVLSVHKKAVVCT